MMLMMTTGCQSVSKNELHFQNEDELMTEADLILQDGRLYQAKKLTREFLAENPESVQGQQLMAKILEQEISRQKETFKEKVPEEYESGDSEEQVRTWLERADAFFRRAQYEEAMNAAETVFTFDPQNIKASKLVDAIRAEALNGKIEDKEFLKRMHGDELDERVVRYKAEARRRLNEGRLGAAELSIKKALLISSEDKEANQIYKQIKAKSGDS